MLEQMRDSSGSFVIWVLFAIIIAAFVLFFGSPSDSLGCGTTKEYALEVDGEEVSVNSWRFAYNGIPYVFGNVPADQRRPMALELLLQREILADQAEKLDFKVSTTLVNEAIQNGDFYLMGNRLDGSKIYFNADNPEYPFFEYDYLDNLVRGRLGLPNVDSYKKEQRRELMAHLMKQQFVESAYVSEEEARQNFVMANTTVSADYVKFDIAKYRAGLELSEAEVKAYAASHEDELKTEWEQVKPRWETDKERVKVRIIKIARTVPKASKQADSETTDEGADEVEPAPAAPEKDVEEAPEAAAETLDPARTQIEEVRASIAGGADFASVAKDKSEDQSASLGGYVGWRASDSMGFGPEVVAASADLAVGKVSDVIEADSAYYLVLIEERTDKGLSFAQKKFDLAIKAAPESIARERAKAAAEKALAQAKTTPLSELFPASSAPEPSFDLDSLPAEIREQLTPEQLQKLMESAVPNAESGAIYSEGYNRLAQLGGEEKPAPAPAKPAPAKPATAKPAPAKPAPAKPAAKPAPVPAKKRAPAETAPAEAETAEAEAALPGAAGADSPPEAAATSAPGSDTIPAPELQKIVGTTRSGDFIAGLGRSKELVGDLFGELAIGALADKVYEVSDGDGFVIIKLVDRSEADMEQFKEDAASLQETLAEAKGGQRLQRWVANKCLALRKAGAIKANASLLTTGAENTRIAYEPCSYLTPTN